MEYTHDQAVANQINVDFDVYRIRTKISKQGSVISKGETILKRDRRTRKRKWETTEDEIKYDQTKLDRAVVAKDQIRTIVRTFRDKVRTEMFPGRKHAPRSKCPQGARAGIGNGGSTQLGCRPRPSPDEERPWKPVVSRRREHWHHWCRPFWTHRGRRSLPR